MKTVLTIAGSDSSGGAGMQGDLKTIGAHGLHGLSVITAVTAQNSQEVMDIFPVGNVESQLQALINDISIDAIKIGMLYTLRNVELVVTFLKTYALPHNIPVVFDPLIYASTGKKLVSDDALSVITEKLIPLCTLITPNLHEASYLVGESLTSLSACKTGVEAIARKANTSVLIKGGHLDGHISSDFLYTAEALHTYESPRLTNVHTHGTGCCLSSSIACQLALGHPLTTAVKLSKLFVTLAIINGYPIGKGEGPVDPLIHFITNTVTVNDVANCCLALGNRPLMAEASEEMADIIPLNDGLVINLGTLTAQRRFSMLMALNHIDSSRQKVLLDPVGCSASSFRLETAKDLLHSGKISVLKVNPREGLSLCDHDSPGAYGVDSDEIDIQSKLDLANALLSLYARVNSSLVVVITGKADVIANQTKSHVIRGGTAMQKKITGTGCMLNAVIMSHVTIHKSLIHGVISGVKAMNLASQRATRQLKNKQHTMTYKALLINELAATNKDIYLITDESLDFEQVLLPRTEEALREGIAYLQYRAKHKSGQIKYHEALTLRELTQAYGVNFIINDDIQLAKSVHADGVHLGIHDASVKEARKLLGDKCIIGATAKTVAQAQAAEQMGADYLGVGALNPSPTKTDALQISIQDLEAIKSAVKLPIYGIGGIRHNNLSNETLAFIDGIAVVSAIYEGGMKEMNLLKQLIRS